MDQTESGATAAPEEPPAAPPPGLLDDLGRLGRSLHKLFGAQLRLLAAELGLARAAVHWLLAAGLIATVAAVGMGLTLLGLAGWLLAQWFGSWTWARLNRDSSRTAGDCGSPPGPAGNSRTTR